MKISILSSEDIRRGGIYIHWKYVSEIYTQMLKPQGSCRALYYLRTNVHHLSKSERKTAAFLLLDCLTAGVAELVCRVKKHALC